jgi:hypothetical protein
LSTPLPFSRVLAEAPSWLGQEVTLAGFLLRRMATEDQAVSHPVAMYLVELTEPSQQPQRVLVDDAWRQYRCPHPSKDDPLCAQLYWKLNRPLYRPLLRSFSSFTRQAIQIQQVDLADRLLKSEAPYFISGTHYKFKMPVLVTGTLAYSDVPDFDYALTSLTRLVVREHQPAMFVPHREELVLNF